MLNLTSTAPIGVIVFPGEGAADLSGPLKQLERQLAVPGSAAHTGCDKGCSWLNDGGAEPIQTPKIHTRATS